MEAIFKKLMLLFMGLFLFSCSPEDLDEDNTSAADANSLNSRISKTTTAKSWNFNDLVDWQDASLNGVKNYFNENGHLNIFTHANSWERTKVKSISSFGAGTYSWNVYVPEMGVGDMASIAGFLYNDETHELDFEIGYGNQAIRTQLAAEADDLIVYMTSQGNPFQSVTAKIKRGQWYNLALVLVLNANGRYAVSWKINGIVKATSQLNYGKNSKFNIYCSVENLQFIGDHIPYSQNYALFDSVEFKP